MSGYFNGPYLEYCPNVNTNMTFFARNIFNNKIHGEFVIRIFVDNVERSDFLIFEPTSQVETVEQGTEYIINEYPFWLKLGPYTSSTNTNKEFSFDLAHPNLSGYYSHGFGLSSNNIRIEVKFRKSSLFSWTVQNFYFRSNAIQPEKAVVSGTNELLFCSPNEILTVEFNNIPSDSNNPNYCYWHHQWIWELPIGWRVTEPSGDLSTATNVFQGGTQVKIQAPAIFGRNRLLTVRSEDDWPYPVSRTTPILIGLPSQLSSIGYNLDAVFPQTICYNSLTSYGNFYAEVNLSSPNVGSQFEWESNAGSVVNQFSGNPPNTTITFNNPGINRYVRVRAINSCGTSGWYTKYFDLVHEPFGCSGGGISGLSLVVSPNPATDNLKVELVSQNSTQDRRAGLKTNLDSELNIILINSNQEEVINYKGRIW